MRMLDIIPGIFEKDFDEVVRKIDLVAAHVTSVQIDVADNTLVEAQSFLDFAKLAGVIAKYPHVSFEAHLMVTNPEKYIRPLVDAGFKRLIPHVESNDPRQFIADAAYESVEVGIGIDGPTEIEQIEPFLETIDLVLLMTAELGGTLFLPETVEKIRSIKEHYPDVPMAVQGGMDDRTVKIVSDAGATRIVSTDYIFRDATGAADAIRRLKRSS